MLEWREISDPVINLIDEWPKRSTAISTNHQSSETTSAASVFSDVIMPDDSMSAPCEPSPGAPEFEPKAQLILELSKLLKRVIPDLSEADRLYQDIRRAD